jgi:endonuclease V-like protein UPF0215 family
MDRMDCLKMEYLRLKTSIPVLEAWKRSPEKQYDIKNLNKQISDEKMKFKFLRNIFEAKK